LESLKRNLTETTKNVESVKSRFEKETLKQIENLETKVAGMERSVNVQVEIS
jgi:hypothetical protein